MFRFFTQKEWLLWSWAGAAAIIGTLWYQVQIDVAINDWQQDFWDMIEVALSEPNAITITEYYGQLMAFVGLAVTYIAVALVVSFFTAHWLFRWRTSMVDYYHSVYHRARHIEGAAQRVQEDTVKFTRIMESLGTSILESIMTFVAFLPVLMVASAGLTITFFGEWKYGLVASAVIWTIGITVVLLLAGRLLRLVGVEYDIQAREAAYRKLLVVAEDDGTVRPKSFSDLYEDVRKIHYKNYFRYLWFNIARLSCLQANVLVGIILLAPAIVLASFTLGTMKYILGAFGRVEASMMLVFKSWPMVIELLSIGKRLREFEKQIKESV